MGSQQAALLVLAFDHSAGCLWLEVRAGDRSCALLLVVLGHRAPFVWELCSAGLTRKGRGLLGPLAGRESQQQIHVLGVSSSACWDGCHPRAVCRKPHVRACARRLLNTCMYFAPEGCVLCASHRYTLSSQLVAVLDLEKNLAARGKGLAEASLPSNHPTETGAGALPLALEEKQMKMFSLGEAEVL